jgi:hypothetical protein
VTRTPAGEDTPPELRVQRITVCFSRPRSCEIVETLHCATCGWSSSVEPTLFTPDEHTADECRRRRRDPAFARAQDNARLLAAGLPGLISPEGEDDTPPPSR